MCETPPKAPRVLVPGACEYNGLQGRGIKVASQLTLGWGDNLALSGPSVIRSVLLREAEEEVQVR